MDMLNIPSARAERLAAKVENFRNPSEALASHPTVMKSREAGVSQASVAVKQSWQDIINVQENSAQNELKIVVTGNVGSGKSTSIRAISEIPVVGTETKANERDALHRKETTTVAMEYGSVHIESTKLHLYGTPGQRRFDFMADILCKGASGMVVMIDNGCSDPLTEIDYYLNQHGDFLENYPGIIAITHFEDNNTRTSLVEYHAYIRQNGFTCPVMLLDARNKDEVQKVLMKLLGQITDAKIGKKQLI